MVWEAGPRWCASSRRSPSDLVALRDWLAAEGVSQVAMEATGVYWRPVWHVLESADGPVDAGQRAARQEPAGPQDRRGDSSVACAAVGVRVVARFVRADREDRRLRDLTRYRTKIIQERARETQRVQKLLEDAGIKLDSVVTDVMGSPPGEMLDALIAGEHDAEVMAQMARTRMRPKIPELRLALEGRFDDHHRLMLRLHLRPHRRPLRDDRRARHRSRRADGPFR